MNILEKFRGQTGSLRGNGKASQKMRRVRRATIKKSFTRFLARKPIGVESVGALGARWARGMEWWRARFAKARKDSTTMVAQMVGRTRMLVLRG